MVCVTEEEIVCCVQLESDNNAVHEGDPVCGTIINSAKIKVLASQNVEYLMQEIAKKFLFEPHSFEVYILKQKGHKVVPILVSNKSQQLLKDIGVKFDKDAYNNFMVREQRTDGCKELLCITGIDDFDYQEKDDLLLGASASPTATEGPQNLSQAAVEDPLLISSVMLQETIPYVGLVNQAMTCYLNSLLQALYMTPEFRNALYNWVFDGCDSGKSIPYQLQTLFLNLQTSKKSAIETTELTRSFGWDLSEAWQQHDIQELCRVMFDALEQKFKDTEQADLINRLYQGKMIDYVKCLDCGTEKSRIDTFLDIPLPVRPFGSNAAYSSVEQALQAFVQPETLDDNNQYFCDKCNKKCDAHKGLKFSTIPYLLTLHLKRFDFDYTTMHRIKLNDKVVFPDILDLNSFITSEEESLDNLAEEASGVKCDDSSTTDSGSALDDEGCQTSDLPMPNAGSSTNFGAGENSSDCADDDEGIDVSIGAANLHENEKNRQHNGTPGPYVYELFSIMIHSGSASGGHYYAYIKDFRRNKWFCFDDQTVSRITNEDIYKTYGGGAQRSYYSGAYSSSTNAYMLMYRQIDSERNVHAMTAEEFPPHIKKLLQTVREREESDRLNRERQKEMCKLKVFVHHPVQNQLVDTKIYMHNESTMTETISFALDKFKLDLLVPPECCRLVSYNCAQETIECSFEGREEDTIGDILNSVSLPIKTDWLLEIRNKDAEFIEYKPGGINIKVFAVNTEAEDIDGPVMVRGYETQSFKEFKQLIAKTLNMSEPVIKIAIESYNNGSIGPNLIDIGDEEHITQASICNACKLYVATALEDDPDNQNLLSKFQKIIDKFEHIISLDVILPVNDKLTLEVLSIPPLDVNQNCCDKEIGAGEPNPNTPSASTSPKLPRVSPIQGAPQLMPPPPDAEDSGAPSDQSNSEDSSLSDSDRTLVGDAPDEYLAQCSSTSNSPAASEQHLSSPEDLRPVFLDETWDEMMESTNRCPHFYFKATEVAPETEHIGKTLCVLVDKRINLIKLKKELEPYVGVPMEYFKIYRTYSAQEYECSQLTETLSLSRDGEKLVVKLGRVLKEHEYTGKVYQLLPNNPDPLRFMCEFVLSKGMLVAEAKRDILQIIKKQYQIEIPFNRCRLRKKSWKNPEIVYRDEQKFVEDITIDSNWEMLIQEIPGPEVITSDDQILIFIRHWCPSTMELKPFREIMLEKRSIAGLKEKLSVLSSIPVENIEVMLLKETFPHEMSVLAVHTELDWNNASDSATEFAFCIYDNGSTFFFRDSRESLKELTTVERREIRSKEGNRIASRYGKHLFSPRRERALKIYLDTSPKKSDYPEVD